MQPPDHRIRRRWRSALDVALSVSQLARSFGAVEAVRSVTLEVQRGEVIALLGPNGAGKTTTVRMLSGLLAPSLGSGHVLGERLDQGDEARRRIRARVGLLTETPALYERLSAWQNLLFFARLHRVEQPQQRVEEVLRLLDLWGRRKLPSGSLSKGQRQKVAVARALLHDPELLFLDEPTSGLDPKSSRALRTFLEELRCQGRTIVLTTHNLDEVGRLADRVGLMREGRLLEVDRPQDLRRRLFGSVTRVTLAERLDGAEQWVLELPGVSEARWDGAQLVVTVEDPERDNPELVRMLAQRGGAIRYVEEASGSLEAAYLQLVEGAA